MSTVKAIRPGSFAPVRLGFPKKGELFCYLSGRRQEVHRAFCDLHEVFPVVAPETDVPKTIDGVGLFCSESGESYWGSLKGFMPTWSPPHLADNWQFFDHFYPVPYGIFHQADFPVEEGIVPDGYQATIFRQPRTDQLFLENEKAVPFSGQTRHRLILEKVDQITIENAGMDVLFSDDGQEWEPGTLGGIAIIGGEKVYLDDVLMDWKYCKRIN